MFTDDWNLTGMVATVLGWLHDINLATDGLIDTLLSIMIALPFVGALLAYLWGKK